MIPKAKKILRENNLPENYSPYLELVKTLNRNIGYVGTFTQFLVVDKSNLDQIKLLYRDILDVRDLLPTLGKNVVDYEKFEDLKKDIKELKLKRDVKQFLDCFPSLQKDLLYKDGEFKKYESNKESANKTVRKVTTGRVIHYIDCERLLRSVISESSIEQRDRFLKGVSAYRNVTDLVRRLMNLKNLPTISKLIKTISQTDGCIINHIDEEKGIIVVRLLNFTACNRLAASTNWCIAREKGQFRSYLNKGKQFMIYNIYSKDDRYSMIGVTTTPFNKITDIFDKYNSTSNEYIHDQTEIRDIFTYNSGYRTKRVHKLKYIFTMKNLSGCTNESFKFLDKYLIGRMFNFIVDWY